MIYALLSQNLLVKIYALIPPIFLVWKIVPALFFLRVLDVYSTPTLSYARSFLDLYAMDIFNIDILISVIRFNISQH